MRHGIQVMYRREHAKNRPVISTPEEVGVLIDALLAESDGENLAELHSLDRELLPSGWPDHELLVGVCAKLGVGVLEFMDSDGSVVTFGSAPGRGEISYFYSGGYTGTEFPDRAEVSLDLIRRAVKEFVVSGGQRPTCVQWQVLESW